MRTSALFLAFALIAGHALAQSAPRTAARHVPQMRVAQPAIVVPDLVGQTADGAARLLASARLERGRTLARESDRPKGTILEQKPPAGTRVAAGTRVDLLVSSGPAQRPIDPPQQPADDVSPVERLVSVPNLIGSSLDLAPRMLERLRLEPGRAIPRPSDRERGTILQQRPAAGTRVRAGTRVDVIVSEGPPPPAATVPPPVEPVRPVPRPPADPAPPSSPPAPEPVVPVEPGPQTPIDTVPPVAASPVIPAPAVTPAAVPVLPVAPPAQAPTAPPVRSVTPATPVAPAAPARPVTPAAPAVPVVPVVPVAPELTLIAETPVDDPPVLWTMPMWLLIAGAVAGLLFSAMRRLRRIRRERRQEVPQVQSASPFVFAPRIDAGRQRLVLGDEPIATLDLAMHMDPGLQHVIHIPAAAYLEDSHERARSDAEGSLRAERRHRRAS